MVEELPKTSYDTINRIHINNCSMYVVHTHIYVYKTICSAIGIIAIHNAETQYKMRREKL